MYRLNAGGGLSIKTPTGLSPALCCGPTTIASGPMTRDRCWCRDCLTPRSTLSPTPGTGRSGRSARSTCVRDAMSEIAGSSACRTHRSPRAATGDTGGRRGSVPCRRWPDGRSCQPPSSRRRGRLCVGSRFWSMLSTPSPKERAGANLVVGNGPIAPPSARPARAGPPY